MTRYDSAFPVPMVPDEERGGSSPVEVNSTGMSLLAYFVSHAPIEPWSWFKPSMPEKPQSPKMVSNDGKEPSDKEYRTLVDWMHDGTYDIDLPNFTNFIEGLENFHKAKNLWDVEYQKQRDIQWPIFWADNMIYELRHSSDFPSSTNK